MGLKNGLRKPMDVNWKNVFVTKQVEFALIMFVTYDCY